MGNVYICTNVTFYCFSATLLPACHHEDKVQTHTTTTTTNPAPGTPTSTTQTTTTQTKSSRGLLGSLHPA